MYNIHNMYIYIYYNLFVVDFLHHRDFGQADPLPSVARKKSESSALLSLVRTWLTMYSQ